MAQFHGITLRTIAVSAMDNNVYLLTSRSTGSQVLIDAADEPEAIAALLRSAAEDSPVETRLELIVTTHSHGDHVRALAALSAQHQMTTAAGAADALAIEARTGVPQVMLLHHGDTLTCGEVSLAVIGLRGHTPGSVALAYSEPRQPVQLFTGDSLFPGGVGNTQGDPVRFTSLLDDVITRIFDTFPDDTVVHPGHGAATTLGRERPALTAWRARGW